MQIRAALDAFLVATILGCLLVLGTALLARVGRRWSAHLRHTLVLVAMAARLAIPILAITLRPGPAECLMLRCLPSVPADAAARSQEFFTAGAAGKFGDLEAESTVAATTPGVPTAPLWLLAWGVGAAIVLAGIFRRHRRAWRLVRGARVIVSPEFLARVRELARRAGVSGDVRVAEHPGVRIPAVAGIARPVLLVPPGFQHEQTDAIEMVVLHELAHVRRRDGAASLLSQLVMAAFWFDPATRYAARLLRDLQESAADSAVVDCGVRPSSYASFLVQAFRRAASVPRTAAVGHAIVGECQLESRVRTILDPLAQHRAPRRRVTTGAAAALVATGLAFAASPSLLLRAQGAPAQPTLNRRLLTAESLDGLLRPVFINTMTDRYIAGAAIAVVHEGKLVYRQGFGRREVFHEVPVDADRTIWRIGSVTKVLTGVAVMQLVDRGLVDLDADVNTYLRDVKVPSTFPEPVRVRHLLTHTAGFDQIGLDRQVPSAQDVLPLAEFLRSNLVRIRPPEQFTTYDTYAVTLAGYLVEQVSGTSYEDYLAKNIFTPLAMYRSGIAVSPALAGDVAVGYGFAGSWEAERWEYMNTNPASTVNATVTDMANLMTMLLEGGRRGETRVLSERSVRAMLTRQFANHPDQPGYGYIFFEDRSFGVPGFSHGGSMSGFSTFLFLVPEQRLGVFIASNQESGTLSNVVMRTLIDVLFPDHAPAVALRPRLSTPPDLARFTGRYASSMHHHGDPATGWRRQPFELGVEAQGRLEFGGKPAFPVGPLAFQRDDGALLTFHEDASGRITCFDVNQTVYERIP